jgi:hypothetical protein
MDAEPWSFTKHRLPMGYEPNQRHPACACNKVVPSAGNDPARYLISLGVLSAACLPIPPRGDKGKGLGETAPPTGRFLSLLPRPVFSVIRDEDYQCDED